MTTSLFKLRETTSWRTPEYDPRVRRIVSFDGEGEDMCNGRPMKNGRCDCAENDHKCSPRHAYTLLAAADDKDSENYIEWNGNIRPETEQRSPNHGLKTRECFDFILDRAQTRADLFISFAFTYDATKIMHDIPIQFLDRLVKQETIEWSGYQIQWRQRKWLSITDLKSGYIGIDGKLYYRRKVKIWDTYSYFQSKFTTALDKGKTLFDNETRAYITMMKAERDNFGSHTTDEIRKYCLLECKCLSILIRDLLTQLDRLGIGSIGAYDGPGALANAFYRKVELKRHMPKDDPYTVMGMPKIIAEKSYYGGWFETIISGPIGDCLSLDINSAYPAVAANLPCLAHGQFIRVKEYTPNRHGFYKVGSETDGPWAPFPFRVTKQHLEDKQFASTITAGPGSVLHVHGGIRWVGHEEVKAAIDHFGLEAIPIYAGWIWEPSCNHLPFEALQELYNYRLELKAKDDGAEKAIKLIINAVYGKLAQSIGWTINTNSNLVDPYHEGAYSKPPHQCFAWAAWITSGCRATVLRAALRGGSNVVSIATDGILLRLPPIDPRTGERAPHALASYPEYVNSKELGKWEIEEVQNTWIGRPGIYAYDKKKRDAVDETFKTRGFSAHHFPNAYLRTEWSRGNWEVDHVPMDLPYDPNIEFSTATSDAPIELTERYVNGAVIKTLTFPKFRVMRGFMATKQGLKRTNPKDVIGEWAPSSKVLDFRNTKSLPILREGVDWMIGHDGGIVEYTPYQFPSDMESGKFIPKQTWEDILEGRNVDLDTDYMDEDDNDSLIDIDI